MTDTGNAARPHRTHDEGDPLLVRPYILDAGDPGARASTAQVWPRTAAAPVPDEPVTAVLAAPETTTPQQHTEPEQQTEPEQHTEPEQQKERPKDRRRLLLLAGAGVAAALTLASGIAALQSGAGDPGPSGADPGSAALANAGATPPPAVSAPSPANGSVGGGAASPAPGRRSRSVPASSSVGAPVTSDAAAPSNGVLLAPATAPTTAVTGGPASTSTPAPPAPPALGAPLQTPAALVPTETLAPAPDAARSGTITGPGGFCLDVNGGIAVENNHVWVYDCNGTGAQAWTLATDGTLRVLGFCVQPLGDTTVRLAGCDTRAGEQWRRGPNGSLVNLAGGTCLTDPDSGTHHGSWVRASPCTGGRNQSWTLP